MIDVGKTALRNSIYSISKYEQDVEQLIKYLESIKEESKVEHLSYEFTESDFLLDVTWSLVGSKQLIQK